MFVVYVCPFFSENTRFFINALANMPEIRLGIISQDPLHYLGAPLQHRVEAFYQVNDCLNAGQLAGAAEALTHAHGPIHRLLGPSEHTQVQIAQVREHMNIEGMDSQTANNFRNKDQMKACWRKAGVACAKSIAATKPEDAWELIEQVGFPVCVKPLDGAATQSTFRVNDAETLTEVLRASAPSPERPLQVEEWVTGTEHSFETVTINGEHKWHSLTHYVPGPLDAMRNPWVQYQVILPREVDSPEFDDIRKAGTEALDALGIQTGLTHMEWFRKDDGTIAINEVAARPPGVSIMPLINRAHDIDFFTGWCKLMIYGSFEPPAERKYAAGCAFLRGLGAGRVTGVHGLEEVLYNLGDLVTDLRAPRLGEPKGLSYEGEGWIIVRHPETQKVRDALSYVVNTVRVELAF